MYRARNNYLHLHFRQGLPLQTRGGEPRLLFVLEPF
jgi:hypothetical protein